MICQHAPPILAIDGGGTHCRLACNHQGDIVQIEAGAANVSNDFDAAVAEIIGGLDTLCAMVGDSRDAFLHRAAFVGLAGVMSPEIGRRLHQALPLKNIRIADDRPAAFRGAFDRADGCLAHCGTGSFFGVQRQGQQNLLGGWGPVLGDEAASLWIGRLALHASLETIDGLRAPSDLTDQLLKQFEGSAGIVEYARVATPKEMAAHAQLVTKADSAGDPVAMAIMQQGATHIAKIFHKLDWQPDLPICLTGGIGPFFARYLPEPMQQGLTKPKATPLDGAILMAMIMLCRFFGHEQTCAQ